ncbi:Bromodomain containing protein [Histomonas meleagridis]|uniref:Bromodomain containing protein n=1 Tax=Histomonas meleagridis TaxID=135588 RepID=UPI00355A3FE5|nr:Bromodomain containing protein [Histomonas meleagridis]KAH0806175.1 Bromodomain containing protein [Histomonas meleagridis]
MRRINYPNFNDFISDVKKMLNNGISQSDPIRKEALKLSEFVYDILEKLETDPTTNPFESFKINENAINREAEAKLNKFRELHRQSNENNKLTKRKDLHGKSRQVTDTEVNELIIKIRNNIRSGPALIGIIEIISGKPYTTDLLPFELSINKIKSENVNWDQLKSYVDYCSKSGNNSMYIAPRPMLPPELQQIQDKYEAKIADWLKPPSWDSMQS